MPCSAFSRKFLQKLGVHVAHAWGRAVLLTWGLLDGEAERKSLAYR